jgi:hypothetical protein
MISEPRGRAAALPTTLAVRSSRQPLPWMADDVPDDPAVREPNAARRGGCRITAARRSVANSRKLLPGTMALSAGLALAGVAGLAF